MKKHVALILLAALICALLSGCGNEAPGPAQTLSFADSASIDTIKALEGKNVSITGYMATLSPLSGKYIYLMNLPYQSCPFCVPNTTQLANTMAVYAKDGSTFEFTDRPVKITGKLEMGDYTDEFGYQYNYRIVNASYEVVDLSEISAEYALYQSLAEDGVIADVNAMFDYLQFLCQWTEYQGSYVDENGKNVTYYLYPGDATNFLTDESAYGFAKQSADDYFSSLTRRVNAINASELTELTKIIADAQGLAQKARTALSGGAYTYSDDDDKYTLRDADQLEADFMGLYSRFSDWLTRYQL